MKTQIKWLTLGLAVCILFNSCATVFGGAIDKCQRTKPDKTKSEPARPLRAAAFICDIVLGGGIALIIDFGTCAIYQPCGGANQQNKTSK